MESLKIACGTLGSHGTYLVYHDHEEQNILLCFLKWLFSFDVSVSGTCEEIYQALSGIY
jgi:hypothetical protein